MINLKGKNLDKTEIWKILLEPQYRPLVTKKKVEDEITSLVQVADEVTESIEYDEMMLFSLGGQGSLALQEAKDVTRETFYGYQLETLTREIKKLKEEITKITEKQPSVICAKIYSLPSSEYELRTPLDITVEIHQHEVIAIIPDLELYGEGSNQIEAVNDLKLELLDLYDDLEEMPDEELGEFPRSWGKTLRQLVKKCQ